MGNHIDAPPIAFRNWPIPDLYDKFEIKRRNTKRIYIYIDDDQTIYHFGTYDLNEEEICVFCKNLNLKREQFMLKPYLN